MNYEEFKTTIMEKMKGLLPQDTSLQLQTVCKNNGLKLDGLVISSKDSNLSPTIFLNYYYERQAVFTDFDAICKDILLTYAHNKSTEHVNADFFTDYNLIRKYISYRVISYEKNKELLETVPYVRYLDFAVVFYCLLDFQEHGSATILIHTSHLKLWQVTVGQLYKQACQTAPGLLPYDFRDMSDVISGLFGDSAPSVQDTAQATAFCPMYLLTNAQKLYGASCLLYPGLLDGISKKLGSDLFILPSSIHEVIILPAADRSYCKELAGLVAQVNQTELATDEVLSNHIYEYSRKEQALRICF